VAAQVVAGLGVIALDIIFVVAYNAAVGDALWALAWGAVGIIAAVGVLLGSRVARWVSVAFSIVTGLAAALFGLLGLAAIAEGGATGADWLAEVVVGAILVAALVATWALGALWGAIAFFSHP